MRANAYIAALLEELRTPRSKDHEAAIRAELSRLNVPAPSAKAIKAAQSAQSQAQPPAASSDPVE